MRFSLHCEEHESDVSEEAGDDIEVTAMGSSEFELDLEDVHCDAWDDLEDDAKQDEDNACKIVATVAVVAGN